MKHWKNLFPQFTASFSASNGQGLVFLRGPEVSGTPQKPKRFSIKFCS